MQVLDKLGAGGAQRDGPGVRVAMGAAGVGEQVAEAGALVRHGCQDRGEGADRVVPARPDGGAAGELGDGGAVLLGHHDGGGEAAAEEQLVLAAQQVVLAVSPGGFRVGAVPAPGRRGPGEGFQARPVRCQRPAGVLELARDG